MGFTLNANVGTTTTEFFCRNKAGDIVATEIGRDDVVDVVEDGEKTVVIMGYSEPFELTSEQYGTSAMMRILFTIADGEQKGERFTCMYGAKLGTKAKLRGVVTAAIGRDLLPGENVDFDDLIGARLIVNTSSEMNGKGYVVVKHVSARPAKAKASTATTAKKGDADLWSDDL